jgi:hypothetical protein
MMFRTEGPPPSEATQRTIDAIVGGAGPFIQNFATLELTVAAWLLRVEESHEHAVKFLHSTSPLDSRIKRLQKLLREEGGATNDALVEQLDNVEPLRKLRNGLVHGVVSYTGTFVGIVTWKEHAYLSGSEIADDTAAVREIVTALVEGYGKRFGTMLSLNTAATTVPPPTD